MTDMNPADSFNAALNAQAAKPALAPGEQLDFEQKADPWDDTKAALESGDVLLINRDYYHALVRAGLLAVHMAGMGAALLGAPAEPTAGETDAAGTSLDLDPTLNAALTQGAAVLGIDLTGAAAAGSPT
jgi:hypothetical protein